MIVAPSGAKSGAEATETSDPRKRRAARRTRRNSNLFSPGLYGTASLVEERTTVNEALQAGIAVKSVPHTDAGGGLAQLPAVPGTYALVLLFPRARRLKIGRLGIFTFRPGWYVYVGSAFGPGGLRARCQRHFRRTVQDRWHIDYLKKASLVKAVWFTSDPVRREHQWAQIIGGLPEAETPVLKFGSSDCSCPTHLFYFHNRSYPVAFRRAAKQLLPADPSIRELVG